MKNDVREDIEVSTQGTTVEVSIRCRMESTEDCQSFDFTPTVDELGQIVLVPNDEWCMFVSADKYYGDAVDVVEDNSREFNTTLFAHMLSDDNNYEWFTNVDEIGNAVITPESKSASFISLAEGENLNLITDELEEALTPEQTQSIKEDTLRVIDKIQDLIGKCDAPFKRLSDNVDRLRLDDLDFTNNVETPLKKCIEGLQQLIAQLNGGEGDKVEESYQLNEGTWSLPKSLSDVGKLKRVLAKPITTENAKEVKDTLYNVFGDDNIYDFIDDLEDGEDARYSIKDYIAKFITANKDKFSDRVLKELARIVNIPLTEGNNECYIAVIHIDDEDGTWAKVEAPTKEQAADYLLQELSKAHPDAQSIRVDIDDVVRILGESLLGEEDDELETPDQEFSSAKTSINASKLPAIFGMVNFKPDTLNLDYGGGKFDNAVEALAEKGVTSVVYDPYNRTAEHNANVLKQVRANGGADTVTCSNVLNVIKEEEVRLSVLRNMKSLVKASGIVYITVYEGNGSDIGKETTSGYQLNRKTASYLEEVSRVFPNVSRKGKLIICKK